MDEIKVKITRYADRKHWLAYYDDPMTGKRVTRSTKKTSEREAQREAARWEAELRAGKGKRIARTDWATFRDRYEREAVSGMAKKTHAVVNAVFNTVEKLLPAVEKDGMRAMTAGRISFLTAEMRAAGKSEATIAAYLRHLRAALRWAHSMGMLAEVPTIKMPPRVKGAKLMKGRPITAEEFERMIAKTADVVGTAAAPSWHRLLTGLWLSGLRLGEALELWWDRDDKICVDFTGRRPMFHILAELEKGNQDRALPMTPDFAGFLELTPPDQRTGPVFAPEGLKRAESVRAVDWASRIISRIGKAAGVKVDSKGGRTKYASAHDLRRAFGARWAPRVMPAVLQQLMRHESIETTMKYYVGQNAEATADAVWAAVDNTSEVTAAPLRPPHLRQT